MIIQTLTFVYNEEFLLPFYLKHYDFCDRLNIIFDIDSNDSSREILESNKKVNLIEFKFPDGMDDQIKTDKINEFYKGIKPGEVVLNVDADEFIFTDRQEIDKLYANVTSVKLFNVFRHITDINLDIGRPILDQRRHGFHDPIYNKPIIVNSGLNISWGLGNHTLQGCKIEDFGFVGAHWANADPCFCIDRRVKNRMLRQSKYNLEHRLTFQHHNITEEDVLKECQDHKNDPQVF